MTFIKYLKYFPYWFTLYRTPSTNFNCFLRLGLFSGILSSSVSLSSSSLLTSVSHGSVFWQNKNEIPWLPISSMVIKLDQKSCLLNPYHNTQLWVAHNYFKLNWTWNPVWPTYPWLMVKHCKQIYGIITVLFPCWTSEKTYTTMKTWLLQRDA